MKPATRFRVHVGGWQYRYFASLAEAVAFLSAVFAATGIVLSVTRTNSRGAK